MTSNMCRKYLLLFAHEHVEFRIPEVLALASGLDVCMLLEDGYDKQSPYAVVNLPSEECVQKIASRAILVRSAFELWGQGSNYNELFQRLSSLPRAVTENYTRKDSSFKINVDTFNKRLTMKEKIKKIEQITSGPVDFDGTLDLTDPQNVFHLLEYYGPHESKPPDNPYQIYFGRWLKDGNRGSVYQYHLQKRKFIGNTSMDAALSLIMANMGKARPGALVFDPFVGTGSLLVGAAHYGAYVMGTDIDYPLLHGTGRASRAGQKWRGPDENILSNLRQYGLDNLYVDALVADASLSSLWRSQPMFDAIITDPPYGIREPTQKVGTKKENIFIPEELRDGHISSKVSYHLSDILLDLLNFAARFLKLSGRLVFWMPVFRPEYTDDQVPRHPCFKLIANSEQPLNVRIARRMITLEKVEECQECHSLQGASLQVNPYNDESLRSKYFTPIPAGCGLEQTIEEKLKIRKSKLSPKPEVTDTDCSKNVDCQNGVDNHPVEETRQCVSENT